jgi:hypothetical protein
MHIAITYMQNLLFLVSLFHANFPLLFLKFWTWYLESFEQSLGLN